MQMYANSLTLEIFATDKTSINIVCSEGNWTELFKIKIQHRSVYSIQVRAVSTEGVLCEEGEN